MAIVIAMISKLQNRGVSNLDLLTPSSLLEERKIQKEE
jgi:hypothetical protein